MDEIVAKLRMIISTWKAQGHFGDHPECKRAEFFGYTEQNIGGAISTVRPEAEAVGLTITNHPVEKPNHMLDIIIVEAR